MAPLLEQAGILDEGIEVVFWGVDRGTQTIRDNTGILGAGPGAPGLTITEQFARSMSVREALDHNNLLCYQMNGEPLPPEHGFPVRLIAPGWYGVANVKWLTRIEVLNQRFANNFMARDYVTIREQERDGQTLWTFTTVRHDRLKSAPAKVTHRRNRYTIMGAAWGAPIAAVEIQIDNGPWMKAHLEDREFQRDRGYAWRFWKFDWGTPFSGEHQVRSRAIDVDGNIQPAPTDPFLASKKTFLGEQRSHNAPGSDSLNAMQPSVSVASGRSSKGECDENTTVSRRVTGPVPCGWANINRTVAVRGIQ